MSVTTRSYLVWFSQRVGSSLLAKALENTGIAGRPGEWLNPQSGVDLLTAYGVATAAELRDELWKRARTDNGVLGSKYGMTASHHRYLTELFGGAWDEFFPSCKHVFMTRRNKIRLAVSWWRAIKSQRWHRPTGEPSSAEDDAHYDRDAIKHLVIEACVREADMQEQLARWGVVPYTVIYEDFIAQYEATVRGVLDYLEIPGRETIAIPPPAFDKLADTVSDAWVERFVREAYS